MHDAGNYLGFACWSDQPSRLEDSSIIDPLDNALWCRSHSFELVASRIQGRRATVVITQGDGVVIEDSEFSDLSSLKFQTFAEGVVRRCQFIEGARIVSFDSQTRIEHSTILPGPGCAISISGGTVEILDNVLHNGADSGTVDLFGSSNTIARNNHILPGDAPSVNLQFFGATGYTVDFRNNWWGTTDSTQIAEWILDANDEPDRGEVVDFWPFLNAPVPVEAVSIGSLKSKF